MFDFDQVFWILYKHNHNIHATILIINLNIKISPLFLHLDSTNFFISSTFGKKNTIRSIFRLKKIKICFLEKNVPLIASDLCSLFKVNALSKKGFQNNACYVWTSARRRRWQQGERRAPRTRPSSHWLKRREEEGTRKQERRMTL